MTGVQTCALPIYTPHTLTATPNTPHTLTAREGREEEVKKELENYRDGDEGKNRDKEI